MPQTTDNRLLVPVWAFYVYVAGIISGYFYPPLGILTFGWLIWYRQDYVQKTIRHTLNKIYDWHPADRPLWGWLPILGIPLLIFLRNGITPLDDLSRHIVAYRHHFDYSRQYEYADILNNITFSPWFGFEWLTGHLHATTWNILDHLAYCQSNPLVHNLWALSITIHIIVGTILTAFGIIFVPIFHQAFRQHSMPYAMTGITLALILATGIGQRILQGRPEVILMLGMFAVWRLPPRLWVLVMMILQPLYWLAWIYAAGALLIVRWSWTQRLGSIALILSLYGLFWHTYCGLDNVIHFITMTSEALKTRMVQAGENDTPIGYVFSPFGVVLLILMGLGLYRWNNQRLQSSEQRLVLAMAIFWLLPNQFRYTLYAAPCLAYLWAHHDHSNDPPNTVISRRITLGALCISTLICLRMLPIDGFLTNTPLFETLPPNARVLTFFNPSTFTLPALYPNIKIAPAMEVGFSNHPLQQLLKKRFDARGLNIPFDCQTFLSTLSHFTYVVDLLDDNMLSSSPPKCLQLEETEGHWRLWKVVHIS